MIAEGLRSRLGLGPDAREDHRHAVIDIGSNTVRLVIYGGPPRAPAVLWNEKVSARLGRDLAKSGDIPDAAMVEALGALTRFAHILSELNIERVNTVATAAPRDATNGREFIARVKTLGLAVRVLSGEEEACASAYGAIGAFPEAKGIVADLGGGSLELVSIAGGRCGEGATFPLGTLRLPALRAGGKLAAKVGKLLTEASWARGAGPLYMIGGTWRALASYAMRSSVHPLTDPHGFIIGADEAGELARHLLRAKPTQLAQQRGISTMRAEKLPDAAALLDVLLTELEPEALIFSSWGLREGLYYQDLTPSERALDPLLTAVEDFTAARGGNGEDAALIARWTAGAARVSSAGTERIRLAAAHLVLALHRVEPNLRAAQALEWALDKRWIGIDFGGRAMLAATLRGSLCLTDPHPRLVTLASEGALREAGNWGLALRLALRLAAGARAPLMRSRLIVEDTRVVLQLTPQDAVLASGPVGKDMSALAAGLGVEPDLSIAP